MFTEILAYQRRSVARFFRANRSAKLLTVLGFLAAFSFLIALVYSLFYYGFSYIARDAYFRDAITLYVIELFLLVSFLLVLASALLSGLFALFRPETDPLLMSSPRYASKLPLAVSRTFVSSLWPLLVVILPALAALHRVYGLTPSSFALSILSAALLIALADLIAVDLLLFLAVVLEKTRAFSPRSIGFASSLVFFALAAFSWTQFRSVDLVHLFQARALDLSSPDLAPILGEFHVFPSHLSAVGLYSALHSRLSAELSALLALVLLIVLAAALYSLMKPFYLALWQRSQEHSSLPMRSLLPTSLVLSRSLAGARNASSAIFRKETIAFFRNTRGMLWLGFILFIWLIQIASSRVLVHGLSTERVPTDQIPGVIGMLQFASVLYFVAMFALRFAFPSFSAERKTGWIISSSPIDLNGVFRAKLLFFSILFSIFAVLFTLANAWVLGLALPLGVPVLLAVLLGTVLITLLALSLGVLYPNHETNDPERLSTTLPGIGFIFASLAYGAIGAFAISRFIASGDPVIYGTLLLLSFLTMLLIFRRTNRALARNVLA